MLAIQLERSKDGFDGPRLGPVNGLQLEGQSLRTLPFNIEVLRLIGNLWATGSERFIGLTIETPTLIYAERSRRSKGKFFGPFQFIRVSHATIYASENRRQTIAKFNPIDNDWHLCEDHSNWPRIILLPCDHSIL